MVYLGFSDKTGITSLRRVNTLVRFGDTVEFYEEVSIIMVNLRLQTSATVK
jgi:hypothetical protein